MLPSDFDIQVSNNEWREYQLEVSQQIAASNKKVIVLQAPTGFGKSVVNRAVGKISNQKALILNRTVAELDQYASEGVQVLYGRDRFICNRWPLVSAAEGICLMGQYCTLQSNGCDYYDEKYATLASDVASITYAFFFREANWYGKFSGYPLIVCDEGHSVPDEITSAFSFKIYFSDLRKLNIAGPMRDSVQDWIIWANNYGKTVRRKSKSATFKDKNAAIVRVSSAVDILQEISNPEGWLSVTDYTGTELKPIWPDTVAQSFLWQHAKKFVFTSATIDPTYTMNMLGMAMDDVEIIAMQSAFPAERRPVYVTSEHAVNRDMTTEGIEELIGDIDKISARYAGRGVIHTGNYNMGYNIAAISATPGRFITHTPSNRMAKLEEFKSFAGKGKILLSPSMTEGIDLPYDMCDFQIVAKMPFANLADPLWEARRASDVRRADYAYIGNAINAIVQACGRGMRASDDRCETWILDRSFNRVRQSNHYRFPSYFLEALRYAPI